MKDVDVKNNMAEEQLILDPVWQDNDTAILMSSDENYLPYLAVCLQSLVDNASKSNRYDIVVFSTASESYQKHLIVDTYSKDNVSVRFFNPKDLFINTKLISTVSFINETTYYRLAAPVVLKKFKKVIYTDIDLIFNTDIYKLSEINLGNAPLAASIEPCWALYLSGQLKNKGINYYDYSKNVLKLKDEQKYYNSGVLLMNIDEFIKNNYFEQIKNLLKKNNFLYQDQDILNYLFSDKIMPLDTNWNFEIIPEIGNSPATANIIHFVGRKKPWSYPKEDYADIWWKYARRSPFYEIILSRLMSNIKLGIEYKQNLRTYTVYKFLSAVTSGKLQEKLQEKRNIYKEKVFLGKQINRG